MRRGEVWLVQLDPGVGAEAKKTRPCVIISSNARNRVTQADAYGVLTVAPLTTNLTRIYPFQALITADPFNGLSADSKVQAELVSSADISRFVRRVGTLDAEAIAAIEAALLIHLDIA